MSLQVQGWDEESNGKTFTRTFGMLAVRLDKKHRLSPDGTHHWEWTATHRKHLSPVEGFSMVPIFRDFRDAEEAAQDVLKILAALHTDLGISRAEIQKDLR